MLDPSLAIPGRLYVAAALLPLAAFALLLAVGTLRALCRPYRDGRSFGAKLFRSLGGDAPGRTGAHVVLASMALAAGLAVVALCLFLGDPAHAAHDGGALAARWSERVEWFRLAAPREGTAHRAASALELGYRIDQLTAATFAMVAVVGTAIVVFSLGYMGGETERSVEDHEVERQAGSRNPASLGGGHDTTPPSFAGELHGISTPSHFRRRGRFGRFFLYLALFCSSMLNLLIADNLLQVFVCWELVGVCSFFLIGFYYERPSASAAATKAFIVNRIGDAGFLAGLLIAWTTLGTLNFEEMNRRVRSPARGGHGELAFADRLVRVNLAVEPTAAGGTAYELPKEPSGRGDHLALFPLARPESDRFHDFGYGELEARGFELPARPSESDYGAMPYWLFAAMGLGLFLGCVGKSAQVPLHTWLPDAMEGPTPVSALIHAATMVAAGVYLVGRAYPLFAPEVLLFVSYIGAVTLFVAATIALVTNDIKRVLAYSTVSQLGYMMLALGVGGWVAGLLHLLAHAFFKALLFLCAGSVIHGCHHEQDLRKMGGLASRMRITAAAMLVGVLAIVGAPFFSGWYSKDRVLQSALGFAVVQPQHFALFLLPLSTAAMTGFYMFRLWLMAFAGSPRDPHVFDRARESPPAMTGPLIFLSLVSVGAAWGWPPWDADASALGKLLEAAEPRSVERAFADARAAAHAHHVLAGVLALFAAAFGSGLAVAIYGAEKAETGAVRTEFGGLRTFLNRKWYFDELYDRVLVRPLLGAARLLGAFDKRPTDTAPEAAESAPSYRFDPLTLDGILNAIGEGALAAGGALRRVQTGRLRTYVLALALTAAAMLAILTTLSG